MNKIVLFSVELKNPEDFAFHPGAKAFQEKYRTHEVEETYFAFKFEEELWKEAEKGLEKAGLPYEKSFNLVLEDGELAAHPVHYLTVPALYDLVAGDEEEPELSREVADFPIAQDFLSEVVVARVQLFEELARLNPAIKPAVDEVFTVKRKGYRILDGLPELEEPMRIPHATGVAENEGDSVGTYYVEGWDGRSSLSEEAVGFVKANHLVAARVFEIKGKSYRQNAPNYLVSGKFAAFLQKKFKDLQLTPMTMGIL
ncbi:hypothetical protein L4X63_01920 [Geomonas sp. Red32]|uniref:hypothetical protein n=1 Tax=Geomonas sp. Red32 TaxID=2912856 RepID=UPI00202CD539|nr:hypothetical protein [Geomonas sp. Red32]MCM0080335.1 hypothetical protein [Geomonas sp. Red32]